MEQNSKDEKAVMELALRAGRILLENGAEIFRVEETMGRVCRHYGVHSESAFVLSTGIFMTGGEAECFARVQYIPVARSNMGKVVAVNQLSREIEAGKYTPKEAEKVLEEIERMPEKKKAMQILASGVGSGAFCCLFGGEAEDVLVAIVAGALLYCYLLYFADRHLSKIVGTVGGSLFVTLLCNALYRFGIGAHMNFMIIGSIMPLIPGVAFTNAIRDVADGDYISGSVRMLDALLVFFCIAAGVGAGISFWKLVAGGILL